MVYPKPRTVYVFENSPGLRQDIDYFKELEKCLGGKARMHKLPFFSRMINHVRSLAVYAGKYRDGTAYNLEPDDAQNNLLRAGWMMEQTNELLKATNSEVQESKKILESLANDVRALADVIGPALLQQVKALRDSRMAVVREVHETLTAMRDIRSFFLESAYETEMQRLERFVTVCREIQALKENGVFDAVCDSALRLAVRQGASDEG